MAKAVIVLTDRDDGEGVDFSMEILPPPSPTSPTTPVEIIAFDIMHRLRQTGDDEFDDTDIDEEDEDNEDDSEIDEPTDTWEPQI